MSNMYFENPKGTLMTVLFEVNVQFDAKSKKVVTYRLKTLALTLKESIFMIYKGWLMLH